jgi:hypothetical protein
MRFRNYGGMAHKAKAPKRYQGFGDAGCGPGMITDPTDATSCISAGDSGCPAGMVTDPNDITSCIPAPAGSTASTSSSSGTSSLLTGIGTALTSIFKPAATVKPVASSTSLLVPALFALGAIGAVVYVVKHKK